MPYEEGAAAAASASREAIPTVRPPASDQAIDPELVGPDMFFADYGINGFVDAAQDHLSTFAVDVDTGSYRDAQLRQQELLPPPKPCVWRNFSTILTMITLIPPPMSNCITLDAAPSPFFTIAPAGCCTSVSRAMPFRGSAPGRRADLCD
ncbi:MAG: von Willebrand factor type A domain-containing protein [Caldilineaceae bacterium]